MRRIRSKGTTPEIFVRRLIHKMGFRFRLHSPKLPGKPDLVFPARKKIIEVRGCFWHQHRGCIDSHTPRTRTKYWAPKLERNKRRDASNLRRLRKLGWDVMIVWECATKEMGYLEGKLRSFLNS